MVDSFVSMTDSLPEYESLAASVRRLIDVTIRTEVGHDAIVAATAKIDSVATELSAELMPGTFGEREIDDGQGVASGNVVIGVRNPVAPPLVIHHESDGSVWTEFTLGAAFEGPPGHVHGGVSALVLDHVLGATAHRPGRPAYTGTLTLRYHQRTPLRQPLRADAWVDRVEGVKTFAVGTDQRRRGRAGVCRRHFHSPTKVAALSRANGDFEDTSLVAFLRLQASDHRR